MRFRILIAAILLQIGVLPAIAASDVEKIYRKQCGVCHGDEGDGRGRAGVSLQPPASSFISPASRQRLSTDYIVQIIRDGKAGTSMSAYGKRLSEKQIADLASYIRDQFVVSQNPPSSGEPRGVKGIKGTNASGGKAIYIKHCSACHGDNGNTAVWAKNGLNPPPRNFTSKASRDELSLERMISSVTHGRPGTAMMSFKSRLSEAEIETVVGFIRSEFMQDISATGGDKGSLHGGGLANHQSPKPAINNVTAMRNASALGQDVSHKGEFPEGLIGDRVWGQKFYMANCFTCHGKNGDGKGPRAHFNQPRPRDFTTDETRAKFDRLKLFVAIKAGKRGTVMSAWGKVLSDQEIVNIAEFVYQNFIQKSAAQKNITQKKKTPSLPMMLP